MPTENFVKFTLNGRIPSKKNSQEIRTRGSRKWISPSKRAQAWEMLAIHQMIDQDVPREDERDINSVYLRFWFPDAGRADLTNKAEGVFDAMVKYGVIKDDSWTYVRHVDLECKGVDREFPRVEVTIIYKEENEND